LLAFADISLTWQLQRRSFDSVIPSNLKDETRSMEQSSAVVMYVTIDRDDLVKSMIISLIFDVFMFMWLSVEHLTISSTEVCIRLLAILFVVNKLPLFFPCSQELCLVPSPVLRYSAASSVRWSSTRSTRVLSRSQPASCSSSWRLSTPSDVFCWCKYPQWNTTLMDYFFTFSNYILMAVRYENVLWDIVFSGFIFIIIAEGLVILNADQPT